MSELMSMLGMQKPKMPSYSFASMMMSGPVINTVDKTKGKTAAQIKAIERRQAMKDKVIALFDGGVTLTAKEVGVRIGRSSKHSDMSKVCEMLKHLGDQGLLKIVGRTKPGHKLIARNIWGKACTQ